MEGKGPTQNDTGANPVVFCSRVLLRSFVSSQFKAISYKTSISLTLSYLSILHKRKRTWKLKMNPWTRRFLLRASIFKFHVSFLGGVAMDKKKPPLSNTVPALLELQLSFLGPPGKTQVN